MAEKKKTASTKSKSSAAKKSTRKTAAEKEREKAIAAAQAEKLRKKKLLQSEIISIAVIALGVFLVLAMLTNTCGIVGEKVTYCMKGIFGKVAFALPFFLILLGILVFAQKTALITWRSILSFIVFLILLSAAFAGAVQPLKGAETYPVSWQNLKEIYHQGSASGGFAGVAVGAFLLNLTGKVGLYLISVAGMIIMLLFIIDTPVSQLFDNWKIRREARKTAREQQEAQLEQIEIEQQLKIEEQKKENKEKPLNNEIKKPEVKNSVLPSLNLNAVKDFENKAVKQEDINTPELSAENIPEEVYDIPESPIREPAVPAEEFSRSMPMPAEEPTAEEPIREYEGEDITENRRKILDYVANDEWAKKDETNRNAGLKEPEDVLVKFANKTVNPGTAESAALTEEIAKNAAVTEPAAEAVKTNSYKFPPIDLLKKGGNLRGSSKGPDMSDQAHVLEDTLHSFGVSATVLNVTKGPAVTRFEVQPAPGVQVSKITRLHDDIALNLRAKSIRIEAPIPGKAAVGIEVSNEATQTVTLRELVDSKEFKQHKSKIAVTLGKSISGENIVCDIHDMPHLLIAGTTGSGKSVCIDSMLISLLYHAKPNEVKLILIDPKIVELTPFNGIPHLLIPVVTEPSKASVALGWAVSEMNNRYNKFAEEGVKDLESFNESVKFKGETDQIMPEIVIVIDELADLMMAAQNQVEDSICRLAQKARAAGMHLVIATQRPSTDVITGVIKANIPSRIALSVSSSIDSRVILDMTGAENLLGRGDMLYSPQSLSKPIRVQGTYISDAEMKAVIDFVKEQAAAGSFNEDIINAMDKAGANAAACGDEEGDELFMDALETVIKADQCSVSMLQRRFRIGYNRAARLVDMMEERGMVGPADGARPRKVLMTQEEFDEYEARTAELSGDL